MGTRRLENLLGVLAVHVTDEIVRDTSPIMPQGLSAPAAAITFVGHNPGATIAELSTGLSLSHPGAVRLVDRLAASSIVERKPSVSDGRAVTLWLSEAGDRVYKKLLRRRASGIARLLEGLSENESKTLEHLIDKLLRSAFSGHEHALRICRLCDDVACDPCPIEEEYVAQLAGSNQTSSIKSD